MKRLLLIDNSDVSTTLESVKEDIDEEIEVFAFNPNQEKFEESGELKIEKISPELIEEHFGKKIDVVGVDFNLHESNKSLPLTIIEEIRKYDKCCLIFMYSGGVIKYITEMTNDQGKKAADDFLREILSLKIDRVIHGRAGVLKQNIIDLLNSPSPQLLILETLEQNIEKKFIDDSSFFANKNVQEVFSDIKKQNVDGCNATNDLINQSLSVMLKVNIE